MFRRVCPIRSKVGSSEVNNNTLVTHTMPRGRPPKTNVLSISSNPWQRWNPKINDKTYLESGRWKCEKSPSGAHHWIIKDGKTKCKYCLSIRQLSIG